MLAIIGGSPRADAGTVQEGFQESIVFSGLTEPTAIRFAPDGHIFVAEKRGVVRVFKSANDTNPATFIDLRTNVYNFWDRGLLGLAVHPDFPNTPYVYVLYTYDGDIGQTNAPKYGTPDTDSDPCADPTGAGCVVSGRLSRIKATIASDGTVTAGAEEVMIHDWCQQFPSHSVGSLVFGHDNALYVSAGEGANFNYADIGWNSNPCGDPIYEGGALRSQDIMTSGDPLGLDGTVVRIDPMTGEGLASNPRGGDSDANARRILAHGLRNPFRINVRPGNNNEIWIGDVGWNAWEEINVIRNTTDGVLRNFGWPCYEGNAKQDGYDSADVPICENLYMNNTTIAPFFTYGHAFTLFPGDQCPSGGSAVAGIAFEFYSGAAYPSRYNGALFFADYSRNCIWAMLDGGNGGPNPLTIENFVVGAAGPVDLQLSPDGELFYVGLNDGTIRRIRYCGAGNQCPVAAIVATPTSGTAPLTVSLSGSTSSDPDNDPLTYAWDLNDDQNFTDASGAQTSYTFTQAGTYRVRLRVTDSKGATDTASVKITVSPGSTVNTPPTATIFAPAAGTTWKVGDIIQFSGSATDAEDGALPSTALSWSLVLYHCSPNCHTHPLQDFTGGSGSFVAPDHEYPAYLELTLRATDSGGLVGTNTLRLDPRTVALTFQTVPGSLQLVVGSSTSTSSFTRTVIVGSTNTISAPSPQKKGKQTYAFQSWSDGGTQSHVIVAPANAATYTARFK